jgi:hypothetical protein
VELVKAASFCLDYLSYVSFRLTFPRILGFKPFIQVSHSLRHGDKPLCLKLISGEEAQKIMHSRSFASERIVQWCFDSSRKARINPSREIYGCRYCTQPRIGGESIEIPQRGVMQSGDAPTTRKKKRKGTMRLYNFNALRFHLKMEVRCSPVSPLVLTAVNRHDVVLPGAQDFFS